MKDSNLQLALREWWAHLFRPITIGMIAGISLILTLVAPFTDSNPMGFFGLLGYWLFTVSTTYAAGALINDLIGRIGRGNWSIVIVIGVSCLATGIAIAILVTGINAVLIDYVPAADALPMYLANIFGIAFLVAALFHLAYQHKNEEVNQPARILERIAFDKRGELMALSVEDHYVRIFTTKGEDVVLLRLRDAMRETGDVAGLQVHRSHWVALNAVSSARRDGDRAILTLRTGNDIPVSRRYVGEIRKAGLLAK